jgi:hypothetical protein
MSAEADAYLDVIDALRSGAGARLDARALELPDYAVVLVEAMVAALCDDPGCRERRPAAFEAFWAGRPPTLDNARVQYGGIMAPFTTPDLRWIYKEASWDLGYHDKADEPLMAVLSALRMLAAQELEARMAQLEMGPEDTVLDTAWRTGAPASGRAEEREAARRNQLLALCVLAGLAAGALEFLALTFDASLARSRRGIVTHLAGAGPLLPPLPAFGLAVGSGVLAGRACYRHLAPGWEGLGHVKTAQLLALGLLAPAALLGWHVFGRLKLLVAVALPAAAAIAHQKRPATAALPVPPR